MPIIPDPLEAADTLAERLVTALLGHTPPPAVGRPLDQRNARALAAAVTSLALVSMARDVRRAVDMANQFYFEDQEHDE